MVVTLSMVWKWFFGWWFLPLSLFTMRKNAGLTRMILHKKRSSYSKSEKGLRISRVISIKRGPFWSARFLTKPFYFFVEVQLSWFNLESCFLLVLVQCSCSLDTLLSKVFIRTFTIGNYSLTFIVAKLVQFLFWFRADLNWRDASYNLETFISMDF